MLLHALSPLFLHCTVQSRLNDPHFQFFICSSNDSHLLNTYYEARTLALYINKVLCRILFRTLSPLPVRHCDFISILSVKLRKLSDCLKFSTLRGRRAGIWMQIHLLAKLVLFLLCGEFIVTKIRCAYSQTFLYAAESWDTESVLLSTPHWSFFLNVPSSYCWGLISQPLGLYESCQDPQGRIQIQYIGSLSSSKMTAAVGLWGQDNGSTRERNMTISCSHLYEDLL